MTETMPHSLSAQVSHYSRFIQQHPGWIYAGVYADRGVSGAKEDRPEFQRLTTSPGERRFLHFRL